MEFHVPVMVEEVVKGVVHCRKGIYLDATAGGGGHSLGMLGRLDEDGGVIAVDRDREAVAVAAKRLSAYGSRVKILHGAFGQLKGLLHRQRIGGLHGALFDLGVSSHQIDEPQRGFSYRREGPLDMRMDAGRGPGAGELLRHISEGDLARLIFRNGEDRQARRFGQGDLPVAGRTAIGDHRRFAGGD